MSERVVAVCVTILGLACLQAQASDRWEGGTYFSDDGPLTANALVHPTIQVGHDLEGVIGDDDWMITQVRARHSYEARVRSSTLYFGGPSCTVACPAFDRVDSSGTVLTPGVLDGAPIGGVPGANGTTVAVRWIANVDAADFLRVTGDLAALGPSDQYDLEFYETTYFAPRFNNSATQVTVLVVQNTRNDAVTGNAYFYDAAGGLLHTQALSLAPQGALVLNTATIPALQGKSGSLAIAHLGGYGALAGKAVALEPATGFTFDTLLLPMPR